MTADLFTPFQLGSLSLPNRFVMPALTRSRAGDGDVPTSLNALYYAQRAGAGLMITEGSQVSPAGKGYVLTPGIHTPAQAAGWRLVTDAVHAKGGRIFLQLWHVGRVSHPDLQPEGRLPVGPSAIAPEGLCYTQDGFKDMVAPRALTVADIAGVVDEFRQAALLAREAGFDGVELHAANGYLFDQFLQQKSNQRTDPYGGTVDNRARLLLEVVDAVSVVYSPDRIGVRISPENRLFGMGDDGAQALFEHVAAELSARQVGYLSVIEGDMTGQNTQPFDYASLRRTFKGCYIANLMYDFARATQVVREGRADLVAFGRPFLANPDLVDRFRKGAPLNEPDQSTFYGGTDKGYTDYPLMNDAVSA